MLGLAQQINKISHPKGNFAHRQFSVLVATWPHLFVYYGGEQGGGGGIGPGIFLIISTTAGTWGIHHDLTTSPACMYLNRPHKG